MRLLLVEDEELIGRSVKKGLEQEGFAVDLVTNGNDAEDMASTEPYDLIILDWMLPGKDGREVCKNLRQSKITVPVLMLTAKSQVEDIVTMLNTGADDYLSKPFAFEELLARCRALIRRPRTFSGSTLQIETLTIFVPMRRVTVGDTEIVLTAKEYALLEYLVRNRGTILSKQQIIDHVWDFDADILPNTLEVTMKNLRDKIGVQTEMKHLITTRRGFGYGILL